MLKLRINPIVVKDLKNIRDYIAEDNEEYAAKTINNISKVVSKISRPTKGRLLYYSILGGNFG